jgi:hypothetical protein
MKQWTQFIRISLNWRGFLDGPWLNNKACLWQITCVIALMHFQVPTYLAVNSIGVPCYDMKKHITYDSLLVCFLDIWHMIQWRAFKCGFLDWHAHGKPLAKVLFCNQLPTAQARRRQKMSMWFPIVDCLLLSYGMDHWDRDIFNGSCVNNSVC